MNQIKFGNRVKDIVTGFEGIVTGEARYMNGCEKWGIDGKFVNNQIECLWVDKQQVIKIDDGFTNEIPSLSQPGLPTAGGPMRTPSR